MMKNNILRFSLIHPLVGKGRPKFTTIGGYVHTYTPKKTREYEEKIKDAFLRKAGDSFQPFTNACKVKIIAYHQIPKGTSKAKTKLMLEKKIIPTKKPDADNIEKVVLDALNKVAFKDDNQIVDLHIKKYYYTKAGVVVEIEELQDEIVEQISLEEE